MDDEEVKYGIRFTGEVDDSLSSSASKVRKEINKVPEERTTRFTAQANFKKLDREMQSSIKNWQKMAKQANSGKIFGSGFKGMLATLTGNRNYKAQVKETKKVMGQIAQEALKARQKYEKQLTNLKGSGDKDDMSVSKDSLIGETLTGIDTNATDIENLKNKMAELGEERAKLLQEQKSLNMIPDQEKIQKEIIYTQNAMAKLNMQKEKYSKLALSSSDMQTNLKDTKTKLFDNSDASARLAVGYFNRTGNDNLYKQLIASIDKHRAEQQANLDSVRKKMEGLSDEERDAQQAFNDAIQAYGKEPTGENEQALKDAEDGLKAIQDIISDLSNEEARIKVYIDTDTEQRLRSMDIWKKRGKVDTIGNDKSIKTDKIPNLFNTSMKQRNNRQATLSNQVSDSVSDTYLQNIDTQLDNLIAKKQQLDQSMRNVKDVAQSKADTGDKLEKNKQQIDEISKKTKQAEQKAKELQNRYKLLNQELNHTVEQWNLLNEDLNSNPNETHFKSEDMQSADKLYDSLLMKQNKYINSQKKSNVFTRIWRRVLINIRSQIASLINPLNLWNKGWNSWLDRFENKQLKNTFEMIKYNLVTAFAPLFEKAAQFLLKLAQIANIFTKKFVGVDLFDGTDWKKNQAMLNQMTASFDELHSSGENTDTIFDSGNFKMEPLSTEQIKFWEGAADKVKKAWEGVKKVFQWIIDHWKWLVAAWAAYKIGKGLLSLLDWGKNFGGLLKGLTLGNFLSGLSIAIGSALTLYGIFQDIKLATKWDQMPKEEHQKTADKGDTAMGIGGALIGGGAGYKLAGALGLTKAAGVMSGATFAGGIALGISGTANAITGAINGDYKMVQKESTKAGAGIGMAAGTVIGVKLGASLGAFAGPVGAAIGAVVGAGLGWATGKVATFFGDVGGDFSKLKISTDDLKWATDQYNTALGNEYTALQNLQTMEQQTGQSGEELYKQVENGTIKFSEMTTEQKLLYKAYGDYKQAVEDTSAALKTQTDYENSMLKAKAEETGDFSEFIDGMLEAHNQGIYSSEELQDRLSQVYAELSKDEREVFLTQLPEDMRQGVETGAEQYYSGWEKFKINCGKAWEDFKEGWGQFWDGVGTKAGEIWNGITTTLGGIWDGMKTTAGNVWNSIKIEAGEAWENIKNSAIGQKVQEIATNVSEKWNEIKTKAGETWEHVKTKAGELWGGIKETVGGKVEELKTNVQEKWNTLKTKAGETWENIKTKASTTWDNIKNTAIGKKVQETVTNAKTKFNELKTNVSNGWNTLKTNASTAWGNIKTSIVNAAKGAWDNAKGFFDKIGEGVKKAWEGLKGLGERTGQRFGNFFSGKGFKTDEEYAEYARKHNIPGYAVGTNYVPNDQLAMVHKGEAIIPARYNKPYTPETGNSDAVIAQMTQEIANLRSLIQQGIPVKGEFKQRGSDLVAVVQKGQNKNGKQPLNNPAYAR